MATIKLFAAVSLDGYVADDEDGVGPLFDWYGNGTEPTTFPGSTTVFHVSPATKGYLDETIGDVRTCLIGRRLFDLTDGWGGVPAAGEHVVVVSHRPEPAEWRERFPSAPFTFAPSIEEAVREAAEVAGDGTVSVAAGDVGGQVLAAGLADEVHLALVPAVLGKGRPYFGSAGTAALLENPTVVEGDRVTHLAYRVRRH